MNDPRSTFGRAARQFLARLSALISDAPIRQTTYHVGSIEGWRVWPDDEQAIADFADAALDYSERAKRESQSSAPKQPLGADNE